VPNAYSDFCYFGVSPDAEQIAVLEKLLEKNWNSFCKTEFALIGFSYKQTWYVDWLPVRATYILPTTASLSTRLAMVKVGS